MLTLQCSSRLQVQLLLPRSCHMCADLDYQHYSLVPWPCAG